MKKIFFFFWILMSAIVTAASPPEVVIETQSPDWVVPVHTYVQIGTLTTTTPTPTFPQYKIIGSPPIIEIKISEKKEVLVMVPEIGPYEIRVITIPPTIDFLESEISAQKVILKWKEVEGVTLWEIWRKEEGGSEEWLGTSVIPSFTDNNVKEGTIYQYRIVGKINGEKIIEGTILIKIPSSSLATTLWYPNPACDGWVKFKNLPNQVRIRIFNIAGEEVLNEQIQGPEWTWNAKNNSGERVASGIYIILLTDGGEQKKGKLGVIK